MRVSIVTIFPDFFASVFDDGMIRVAREKGRLALDIVNLRDFTEDLHRTVDDTPFGGGPGMVMKIEPIDRALRSLAVAPKGQRPPGQKVLLTSPQGRRFDQGTAIAWSGLEHVVIVCGRYKGVDERVAEHLIDEEFSIGDFVLSGGEPAALCVVDALARLQPDVLGRFERAGVGFSIPTDDDAMRQWLPRLVGVHDAIEFRLGDLGAPSASPNANRISLPNRFVMRSPPVA